MNVRNQFQLNDPKIVQILCFLMVTRKGGLFPLVNFIIFIYLFILFPSFFSLGFGLGVEGVEGNLLWTHTNNNYWFLSKVQFCLC